jgi:hypothetical protein
LTPQSSLKTGRTGSSPNVMPKLIPTPTSSHARTVSMSSAPSLRTKSLNRACS